MFPSMYMVTCIVSHSILNILYVYILFLHLYVLLYSRLCRPTTITNGPDLGVSVCAVPVSGEAVRNCARASSHRCSQKNAWPV